MPSKTCGCGFGHTRSAFGRSADSFFGTLNGNNVTSCLSSVYNNAGPLSRSSGFGKKSGFGNGPMKIGNNKKR